MCPWCKCRRLCSASDTRHCSCCRSHTSRLRLKDLMTMVSVLNKQTMREQMQSKIDCWQRHVLERPHQPQSHLQFCLLTKEHFCGDKTLKSFVTEKYLKSWWTLQLFPQHSSFSARAKNLKFVLRISRFLEISFSFATVRRGLVLNIFVKFLSAAATTIYPSKLLHSFKTMNVKTPLRKSSTSFSTKSNQHQVSWSCFWSAAYRRPFFLIKPEENKTHDIASCFSIPQQLPSVRSDARNGR